MADQPKQPGNDSGEVPKPPSATQPIRLTPDQDGRFILKRTQLPQSKPGAPKVDPKAKTPFPAVPQPPFSSAPQDATPLQNQAQMGPWLGTEETLVGAVPEPVVQPAAKKPASEPWLGKEATLVPTNKPVTPAAKEETWIGNEKTVIGIPVERKQLGDNAGEGPWLGRESTAIGMPVDPSVQSLVDKVNNPQPKSVSKTTATMDDGWHLKGRKGPLTGNVFGDYEVGGILGEGGMGVVYRARQISLKRRVALKVLPPALANDPRLRERFEAEARTASLMNSANVVQVFAAGTIDDTCFFVMEFVEGTDLSEIIKEKQDKKEFFTPEEAADYIIQSARGLAEAGKLGIIHRDIKPANLMVTKKGVVKVADFGISKVAGEHSLTMTGTAVGTPSYCSPEQGRGDPVDPRSDLYSLGVVFYELLTGQKPFDGATANALIYQHNYAEPKLPKDIRPDISDEYQAVALKCLQKDPAKRYQDANEMLSDLERVRAGSAPMTALMSAFGTGADEAMRRLGIKQRKTWPYVLAATLALGGMGGGYWYWAATRDTRVEKAKQLKELRDTLSAAIDSATEHDSSVADNLTKYEQLVASDDVDLQRWRKEVSEITALESDERLARLDAGILPDATLRAISESDLLHYAEFVGENGERYARWAAKLSEAGLREATLRGQLSGRIDSNYALTAAAVEELSAPLAEIRRLAILDDDIKRWSDRLAAVTTRIAVLRSHLAVLDQAGAGIPERDLAGLSTDLDAFGTLLSADHPDAVRWRTGMVTARSVLAGLREALLRLDRETRNGLVDLATLAATERDLERFRVLADPEDAQLKNWNAVVQATTTRVSTLRQQLERLDDQTLLTLIEQQAYKGTLADYATLAGTADRQYQAWSRRLAQDEAVVVARSEELARIDDPQRLSLREGQRIGKAVDVLEQMSAIAASRAQVARTRIDADAQYVERLRQNVIAREKPEGFQIDKPLGDTIREFVDLAGLEDPDAKRWHEKASEYFRLFGALSVLDRPAPIPDVVDSLIAQYQKLVGQDEDVRRWNEKVANVRQFKRELLPVDRIASLPERARENIDALVALVGEDELDARRWKSKVYRVQDLTTRLRSTFLEPGAWVLPPEAIKPSHQEARELVELIGREDELADRIALRCALIDGPPQPAWAQKFGRDSYGIFATVLHQGAELRFRYVPAGSGIIGSPAAERRRDSDESQVLMSISTSFWMADSETTQAIWQAFGLPNPSRFRGADRPVERVSWDEVQAFLRKFNGVVEGLNARLPTEVEWELAARAGLAGSYLSYEGVVTEERLGSIAWYNANSDSETHSVAGKFPNALGLFDLHGNVWEWCQDAYGDYSPAVTLDWKGSSGRERVVRGGSWADAPDKLRAANRLGINPSLKTLYVGFRIAAPVTMPEGGFNVLRQLRRGLALAEADTETVNVDEAPAVESAASEVPSEATVTDPAPVTAEAVPTPASELQAEPDAEAPVSEPAAEIVAEPELTSAPEVQAEPGTEEPVSEPGAQILAEPELTSVPEGQAEPGTQEPVTEPVAAPEVVSEPMP